MIPAPILDHRLEGIKSFIQVIIEPNVKLEYMW